MDKIIIIDNIICKDELAHFLKIHAKSIKLVANIDEAGNKINLLLKNINNIYKIPPKLVLNTDKNLIIVKIEDIVRCESDRNYTCFYLNNNEKIIVSKTLKIFEKQLEKYFFIRTHKSHLININYIKKYIKSNGGYVMLLDGSKIPVSIRKKYQILKLLKNL